MFLNTNTNEKVCIFDSTILNIRSNLIPHEFDDKDQPWFNKKIALSREKNAAFKNYNNSSNIDLKCHLKYLQACLNASIEVAKEKYQYISKLYRSLLKFFVSNKKLPIIPPLFYENHFITDFKEKAELSIFFSKQCSNPYS